MKKALVSLMFAALAFILATNVWSDQTAEVGLGYSLSHIVVGNNEVDVQSPGMLSLMTFGKTLGIFLIADLNFAYTGIKTNSIDGNIEVLDFGGKGIKEREGGNLAIGVIYRPKLNYLDLEVYIGGLLSLLNYPDSFLQDTETLSLSDFTAAPYGFCAGLSIGYKISKSFTIIAGVRAGYYLGDVFSSSKNGEELPQVSSGWFYTPYLGLKRTLTLF